MKYLSILNKTQYKAVTTIDRPTMVIAGAGSGKTRVLIYRLIHLIKSGVKSRNILALTFTKKSANEMKYRLSSLIDKNELDQIYIGTFHSIFAKLLRKNSDLIGYKKNYIIYDRYDSEKIIKKIIKNLNLDKKIYRSKYLLDKISMIKNHYFNERNLYITNIYANYKKYCYQNGIMDFDDILLYTNILFNKNPEILKKYQEYFKYILIDEYQDTNYSQYRIIKLLSLKHNNIFVVGDDSQSIYSFRGANINNILNFKKDYKNAVIIRLEQNYRSTKYIVDVSNQIISLNKRKIDKKLWTNNKIGKKIKLYKAFSSFEESDFVANTIDQLKKKKKLKYSDFGVLYRTNAQSRSLEESFIKKKIPYNIYGSISFYKRKEIKDLIAYFRLIVNINDEESLIRIINYPKRGIGEVTLKKIFFLSKQNDKRIFEILKNINNYKSIINRDQKILDNISNFCNKILFFNKRLDEDAFILSKEISESFGLLEEIKKDKIKQGIDNVEEFLNSISTFVEDKKKIKNEEISLNAYLESLYLDLDLDYKFNNLTKESVSLMTIHLSKGLEFPIIFIIGLEEKIFPSILSISSQLEIEEERRLFYVALTRAKEDIFLTFSKNRYKWGKIVPTICSRFVKEIDKKYIKYIKNDLNHKKFDDTSLLGSYTNNLKEGMIVYSNSFGRGKIIKIEGQIITVYFNNIGEKKILNTKLKIIY
ncbi:ATP-dependent helicase [Candidatus Karelsulcia muelleri]|uniref:DNA 3'-5' helicase n=1 Tax=Candidatus Karelsulcia muelleri PSPU TaxID=1189303 RepID=A0AAD1AZ12_9FLAO|nr:UvrD-helicase domain-containing protein [Candidatus Karelsulcia muelleri]NJJ98631.1 UvrD-helicase domain-containing protein [Candidatus Karelsulcia muelleri]BAO66289.1 DNA helicase II [Candidatus Karelsulcia muelleri PSPU]